MHSKGLTLDHYYEWCDLDKSPYIDEVKGAPEAFKDPQLLFIKSKVYFRHKAEIVPFLQLIAPLTVNACAYYLAPDIAPFEYVSAAFAIGAAIGLYTKSADCSTSCKHMFFNSIVVGCASISLSVAAKNDELIVKIPACIGVALFSGLYLNSLKSEAMNILH